MKFLWPDLLWVALLTPVLMAGLRALLRRRRAMIGAPARGLLAMNRVARPAAAVDARSLAGPHAPRRRCRAADRVGGAAFAAADRHSRHGRLGQHAGARRRAEPDQRFAGRGEGVRVAAAMQRARRCRGLRGFRASGAAAHAAARRRAGRHRSFRLQQGTAIGSGILVSLGAIFPDESIEASDSGAHAHEVAARTLQPRPMRDTAAKSVPPGEYASAVIALLIDGQNTIGPEPMEAAQFAANRGVKVYTVGFGSKDGKEVDGDGVSILVHLDEDTLQKVADVIRAEYFHAGSGVDLDRVCGARLSSSGRTRKSRRCSRRRPCCSW